MYDGRREWKLTRRIVLINSKTTHSNLVFKYTRIRTENTYLLKMMRPISNTTVCKHTGSSTLLLHKRKLELEHELYIYIYKTASQLMLTCRIRTDHISILL
jgi:hypothetical protein